MLNLCLCGGIEELFESVGGERGKITCVLGELEVDCRDKFNY